MTGYRREWCCAAVPTGITGNSLEDREHRKRAEAAASADAGIVYATDAASMADQVTVIAEAPEGSLAQPVIYPVAVVKTTAHAEAAKAFVDFLQTDEAMAVFESYGFAPGQ